MTETLKQGLNTELPIFLAGYLCLINYGPEIGILTFLLETGEELSTNHG